MWIVSLALRRPYTFIVMALVILLLTPVAILMTPVDIFPEINIPVVSVIWTYSGLPAQEMADRIVAPSERGLTTTVNNIEHIESHTVTGMGVIKIFLRPGTDLAAAIAQATSNVQTIVRQLPTGATPPMVISYSASTTPVLQIGISSPSLSEQQMFDQANNFLRVWLSGVDGVAAPWAYGGKVRQIQVDLDQAKLQAYQMSPADVATAVNNQVLALPTGTAKLGNLEYSVDMNGTPATIAALNDVPVKTVNGATLYLRDVAHVRDGFAPQTNIVRQDGHRGALMSVYKNGRASTLQIVAGVKTLLLNVKPKLPPDLKLTPLFDQSLFVRASIQGVIHEALIAALLTACMILLFLGDWRPTLVILISIPLSIFVSILCLSALGETLNIMTLGGLALAVGILVDDATVAIENIERNILMGKPMKDAILDGSAQIAVPAFVSTLCICIVFVPMFFLAGVARYLFVPMAEAVCFAMLASYFLSRTLVPTLVMYIMRGHDGRATEGRTVFGRFHQGFEHKFEGFRRTYQALLTALIQHRTAFVASFLLFCVASTGIVFLLGENFFPDVDAGLIRLHMRARPGLRIEETAKLADQVEQELRRQMPNGEIDTIVDNIGLPYSIINMSYSSSGTVGTNDAEILISLSKHHAPTAAHIRRLRRELPQKFPGTEFFFQPADIVSQILNFGLSAPIDIQISGQNAQANYVLAQRMANRIRQIPGAADVHLQQQMAEPTLHIDLDRTRIQQVGLNTRDVAQGLLISLSGSFQTAPNIWLNPQNGVSYSIAVQTPQYNIRSLDDLMSIPISSAQGQQVLGNLATVSPTVRALDVSHWSALPIIDIYVSTQDRDLGSISRAANQVIDGFRSQLPRGSEIVMRGQVDTMHSSYVGLSIGILGAIILIYFLIVINFQSWLDPLIIISALPAALAGICWILLITRTTLSVPALTGAIMCMGVATSNSILLVSFAREQLTAGASAAEAAIAAGYTRIRPVLMTAGAMIIGMVPMALGLGEGGEQNAPLGRAVIGGLLFATVATLLFVPAVFAIFHGRRATSSQQA